MMRSQLRIQNYYVQPTKHVELVQRVLYSTAAYNNRRHPGIVMPGKLFFCNFRLRKSKLKLVESAYPKTYDLCGREMTK